MNLHCKIGRLCLLLSLLVFQGGTLRNGQETVTSVLEENLHHFTPTRLEGPGYIKDHITNLEITGFIWALVWFCAGYFTQNIGRHTDI